MVEARKINPGFGMPAFSKIEIRDIVLSIAALSLAFTLIYARSNSHFFDDNIWVNGLYWFGICVVLVIFSFMCHEFGHKFVAQKYGAWAEFRMWPAGLGIAIISGFMGFLFAAPGAVYIDGRIDTEKNGKISIAGPAVNFVLAAIALILLYTVHTNSLVIAVMIQLMFYLNAFLGLFNLIPFPPFDGSKIIKWNPILWGIMVAIGAAFLYVYFFVLFP